MSHVHTADAHTADAGDLRAAYERGRREERARHRRHPLLAFAVGSVALVGAVVLVASAVNGSFARGGQSVDHGLSVAAQQAGPTLQEAKDKAAKLADGSR